MSQSVTASSPSGNTVTLKRLVDVLLFVGPSGCGKSTIINQLQKEWPHLFEFSVSHTTRTPRKGEKNGQHYHFVSFDEFQSLINAGAMIEYSRLSSSASTTSSSSSAATNSSGASGAPRGNMYGTSKKSLHTVLNKNKVVLMDTDLLGAINIRRYCAHVVVDSTPVTMQRREKRATTAAEPVAPLPPAAQDAAATRARNVKVLPPTTAAAQPAVAWQVPKLDVAAAPLKCHAELPPVPPVSAMPHVSRLVRCMVIFIAPPSMQILEERLRERKSETTESFRMRMSLNVKWMRWAQENQQFFDYYIVNDNLQQCYARVKRIVSQEVLPVASAL